MDEHITAFIDILGFADAVKSATRSDDERTLGALTTLLENAVLKNSSSGIAIEGETRGELNPAFSDGHLSFSNDGPAFAGQIQRSWTAFSDCVVISYPFTDLAKLGLPRLGQTNSALNYLTDKIARIATDAAKLSLLIRGGIAKGPLHHQNNVVLGKAMIDAYELERSVAIYPRVVLSLNLAFEVGQSNPRVLADEDGIMHLNYFEPMIRSYALGENGDSFDQQRFAAQRKLRKTVEAKIAQYGNRCGGEDNGDLRNLSKWAWFKRHLDLATEPTK